MWSIYKKELGTYFSNILGYLTIGVFLIVIGVFMWLFSETSILEYNYATLDQLFSMAPLIFLFLIPALTIRSFAEEKQNGTLEFLYTKPLSINDIVLGKFWACFTLVALAILPTLIYYYSIYQLGSPKGNLDTGSIIGSYIGLFFLAGAFVSIGIFSSSLTDNIIVSFIMASLLCFVVHWGFSYLANIPFLSENVRTFINSLGMNFHYASISKGALYVKDLVYFVSVVAIFILGTKSVVNYRKN
jgi:ABC-2 type transport system permease protein